MVTCIVSAQCGSVFTQPTPHVGGASASPNSLPDPTFREKSLRAPRTVIPRSPVEAIVDRVLLSGQTGFDLFYRTR